MNSFFSILCKKERKKDNLLSRLEKNSIDFQQSVERVSSFYSNIMYR